MAVGVHALLSLPHLVSGNACHVCIQTSSRIRLVPAAPSCSLFTWLNRESSPVRSPQASWAVPRGGLTRRQNINRQQLRSQRKRVEKEKRSTLLPVFSSLDSGECNDTKLRQSRPSISTGFITEEWKESAREGEEVVKSVWSSLESQRASIRQGLALQVAAAVAAGVLLWGGSYALAADPLKTCQCLLKECRVELARCIADPKCAANVACLQTCNGRPDETECQIGCGDLFENKVVDEFNDCAVTRKGCVPQKPDEGRFPVPPPVALVPDFDTTRFTGTWYITSGLNRTFDTFDCQKHEFTAQPSTLSGNLSWRIPTPDGGFFTRSTVQNFVQDPQQPGVLYNHGNEFLHYQDDWYVLSSKFENKSDDYVFIYYRGKNDAWDGYGGAVVYTRNKTLPASIVPELTAAAKRVNLDFKKFTSTDNTCGPEPPLFARLEKKVEEGERFVEKEVEEIEQDVENVGKKLEKAEMMLFGRLGKGAAELARDEEQFLQELGDEEKQILSDLEMGAADVGKLFGNSIPVRKLR